MRVFVERSLAGIEIQSEQDSPFGWRYAVHVEHDDGRATDHTVTLAWVDHEHWCGGRLAPSRVIEAVVRYALDRPGAGELPARFDAARVRRWHPRIDEELAALL
jgi:hypothetical protein